MKITVAGLAESEMVDIVDENDNVTETRTLADCLNHGLLHRSVIIFLRNSAGNIFLQRRSLRDDWLPGYWTASCTGHVRAGEQPSTAAKRELGEELGVEAQPSFLYQFLVPKITFKGIVERELAHVFEAVSDQRIHFDPIEVEQVTSLSMRECTRFFEKKGKEEITPDARLAFQKYLKIQLGD